MSPISGGLRARIREKAGDRCGYCHAPQQYVLGRLEIDHIRPQALGGADDEQNLWLACRLCNNYKGIQASAIDPLNNIIAVLVRREWVAAG